MKIWQLCISVGLHRGLRDQKHQVIFCNVGILFQSPRDNVSEKKETNCAIKVCENVHYK